MPKVIDRYGVQRLVGDGAQLVDVLPPEDYADSHLPGAISLHLKSFDAEAVRVLDRRRPVIVYCHDAL